MAQYNPLQLTQVGQTALTNAQQNGMGMQFSKIKVGDGTTTNVSALTDLVNTVMTLPLESASVENGIIKISSLLSNAGLSTGFYLREIGIFVIQNGQELLYAYIKATTADFIPPESSGPVTQQLNFQLTVQSGTNITFQVPNTAVALQSDLNTLRSVDLKNIQDDSKNFRVAAAHSGVLDHSSGLSGFTSTPANRDGSIALPTTAVYATYLNFFAVNPFRVLAAGALLQLGTAGVANGWNRIDLPAPPTFGYREDLVFLETYRDATDQSWKARFRIAVGVDFSKYPEGLGKPGGIAWGDYPSLLEVAPQGGAASPVTSYSGSTDPTAMKWGGVAVRNSTGIAGRKMYTDDPGLYVAGDGSVAAKAALQTYDGYSYAIPLFKVKRRNSGGYRVDNVNGAREYFSIGLRNATGADALIGETPTLDVITSGTNLGTAADTSKLIVGDKLYGGTNNVTFVGDIMEIVSSTKVKVKLAVNFANAATGTYVIGLPSVNRPDGRWANVIDKEDIHDLRHKTFLNGASLEAMLQDGVDKLQRAELNTKDTRITAKERFALHRAPYGVPSQLGSVRVKGDDSVDRDLVNLLGTDGDCETSAATVGANVSVTLDTANKVQGNNGIKATLNAATGYQYFQLYGKLQAGKYYLVMAHIKNGNFTNGARLRCVAVSDQDKFYPSGGFVTDASKFTLAYIKLSPTDFDGSTDIRLGLYGSGAIGQYGYGDGFRVYEIDQATYDKIDIDAAYTGDALAAKYPYVNSYQNIIENYLPTDESAWETGRYVAATGANYDVAQGKRTKNFVDIQPSTSYSFSNAKYGNYLYFYQADGTFISYSSSTALSRTVTTPANAYKMKVEIGDGTQVIADPIAVIKPQLEKTAAPSPVLVPFGRWNLPCDIANGDTKVRLDTYQQNRRIVSDRQVTDAITEVVDNLMTPQKHIAVTQATAGVWAAGDTIKVSSEEGIVSGVIDTDTALARVVSDTSSTTVILVDDVSKIAVNDTVAIVRQDFSLVNTYTVTAIDTANKTVTINSPVTISAGYYLVETTASTSSPTVTAAGIAGTWTGLGTKTATYTISTPPTTNTDKIKIAYSVSYPAGKGVQNLPEMYEARVNGQRHVKSADGTITIKANYEGKTAGSTDRNPHVFKRASGSAGLLRPPSDVLWTEQAQADYAKVATLDGTVFTSSTTSNGALAEQLFPFDIIRAITDKLGNEVFTDCPTLADKVAKAKTIVTKIVFAWTGWGSSPTGNKATLAPWRTDNSSWGTAISNTAGTPTKTSFTNLEANSVNKISNAIDSNGIFHVIAYAEASDGITPSTLNTEHADLDITLNLAEAGYDVFVPENPLPVRLEQVYNEGENMLGTAQELLINSNNAVTIIDKYKFTAVGSVNNASMYFEIPVTPNTVYTAYATHDANMGVYNSDGSVAISAYSTAQSITFNSGSNSKVRLYFRLPTAGTTYNFSNWVLTPGSRVYPFVPQTRIRKSKRVLDLLGKVAGSSWENPHKAYEKSAATFSAPSTFTGEYSQGGYDLSNKLDGTLKSRTYTTVGDYVQYAYEFDLSHLGLSLTELKRLLRKLTVSWTGYGQGDNAGAVGYGATLKWWNGTAWTTAVSGATTNTTSAASTLVSWLTTGMAPFVTNDQKLYVLIHTTYPASATNAATLYMDYPKLEVELSEEVDFVKGNIVKVMKETKEIKLEYGAYDKANGRQDTLEVFYSYLPYQGQGITAAHTVLTKPDKAILTTLGTGKERPSNLLQSIFFQAIPQLPIGSAVTDADFINSVITLPGQYKASATTVYFEDLLAVGVQLDEMIHISSSTYRGIRVGDSVTLSGTGKRGAGAASIRNYRRIRPTVTALGSYLCVIPYLATIDGELYLVVITNKPATSSAQVVFADGQSNCAVDIFRLPGRPLVKGVI